MTTTTISLNSSGETEKKRMELMRQLIAPSRFSITEAHEVFLSEVTELENGDIATCSYDKSFKVWSRAGGLLCELRHDYPVTTFVALPSEGNDILADWEEFVLGDSKGGLFLLRKRRKQSKPLTTETVTTTRFTTKDLVYFSESHTPHRGYTNYVMKVIRLSDGRLASGALEGDIKIWSLSKVGWTCVQSIESRSDTINSLIELSDGSLISCSDDKSMILWRRKSLEERRFREEGDFVYEREFCDLKQKISNRCSIELKKRRLNEAPIIASGGKDSLVRLWNSVTGACISVFQGHTQPISGLVDVSDDSADYDNNENVFISASWDTTIRVWSTRGSGQCLSVFHASTPIRSLVLLKDKSLLYGAESPRISRTWLRSLSSLFRSATFIGLIL